MRKPTPDGGPDRLLALSDGVFAIAITLLVLDLSVPRGLNSGQYDDALLDLLPNLGAYALSFLVLAGFWRDHLRIFRAVTQVDGQVVSLCLLGLGIAALVPFPTALISEYADKPASVALYSATVAALGADHLALLLVLKRRPWLCGSASSRLESLSVLELAVTVTVFVITVPVALVTGPEVMWGWLVLLPVKVVLGRRERAGLSVSG
ncbi:TMEM175 family protein [Streptomyces sp. HUAS ZL42]|uniref:TMEM175 family protein n=1 Tax=Streptomyces sp. HUAS ZL42 TaxID=3231715 RepID=UPI00345EE896